MDSLVHVRAHGADVDVLETAAIEKVQSVESKSV
jgi:hypothetical protein